LLPGANFELPQGLGSALPTSVTMHIIFRHFYPETRVVLSLSSKASKLDSMSRRNAGFHVDAFAQDNLKEFMVDFSSFLSIKHHLLLHFV